MLADAELHYVSSLAEADDFMRFVERLGSAPVAVDTETTGLKWWTPRFVRLVQFGTANEAWALDAERWRGVIEEALVRLQGNPVIFHNCAFDMHALEHDGYPTPPWSNVHDTKVMSHLLVPHQSHSLKPLAARYFGNDALMGQSALKGVMSKNKWTWATIPTTTPEYWVYGNMDVVLTARVAQQLSKELHAAGMEHLYEREMAVREIFYRAERRGLLIDHQWTTDLHANWSMEAVALADRLERSGIENPRSNQQVTALLEELEWEPDEFTPSGAAKLDKVILMQMAVARPEWAEIALPLLRYRRITKWTGVYLDAFLDSDNDRIHSTINPLEARTGRMSITGPPMQTLPSRDDGAWMIRRCVVPQPGHQLWTVDYDQQEAREFAHYANDPGMIACILRGEDIYTHTARLIYQDESITKKDPRRAATKVNLLAFLYGAGADKLSRTSGLSIEDARAFIARLFEEFPNVRELTGDHAIGGGFPGHPALLGLERYRSEGLRYVLTKSGRRFSVPNDQELYKLVNGLIQGGGADILKDAVVRLDKLGYADNIVLPVHDELVFEFPAGVEGEYAAREVASIMEDHSMAVPITTELSGPLTDWGQKYREAEG